MDKEPVTKKRRVCDEGSGAGTSGTSEADLASKVKALVEEALRAQVARSGCTSGSSGKSHSGLGSSSSDSGIVGGMFG